MNSVSWKLPAESSIQTTIWRSGAGVNATSTQRDASANAGAGAKKAAMTRPVDVRIENDIIACRPLAAKADRSLNLPSRDRRNSAIVRRMFRRLVALAAFAPAIAVADGQRCLDTAFTPTANLQIVAWLETASGTYVDTVFITQQTGTFGLGNRPGR